MPHIPDSNHDSHDLELVAAYAAGDATGAGLETATALVTSCAECASLDADLRAIATAVPAIPAAVRHRDFRLTPAQAASLRGSPWRRFLAAFSSPKLSFATPLGTGLAALGIVGVLVATGGIPSGGATSGGTASQPDATGTDTMITLEASAGAAAAAGAAQASSAPEAPREGVLTDPSNGSPAPSAAVGAALASPAASVAPAESTAPLDQPYAAASVDPAGGAAATVPKDLPAPSVVGRATDTPAPVVATRTADETLLIVAGMVLLIGVALVALRWMSRRLA